MIQPIVTDSELLAEKSEDATTQDSEVIRDLLDTFEAHSEECVCMAANMIGCKKRIIVVTGEDGPLLMVNPVVTDRKQPYFAEEECLSRPGARARGAKRYKRIRVTYLDADFEEHSETFREFGAQMVLHCIDHCDGIVI